MSCSEGPQQQQKNQVPTYVEIWLAFWQTIFEDWQQADRRQGSQLLWPSTLLCTPVCSLPSLARHPISETKRQKVWLISNFSVKNDRPLSTLLQASHRLCVQGGGRELSQNIMICSQELFSDTVSEILFPATAETLTTPTLAILMFYCFGGQSHCVIGRW